ncbi:MAG: polysaccharide deacetylase family protein [Elusimicrobiota bacterium]
MIKDTSSVVNALSIDVEEWFDTVLFAGDPAFADKQSGLPADVSRILVMLDTIAVKATFFILGSVARKYPDTVKAIASAGHEVASHGGTHRSVFRMSQAEFKKDLADSRAALEKLTGKAPLGYRAPTFSILKNESFYLAAIKEAGYAYDSSLYPVFLSHRRRAPYTDASGLMEFPPSVFSFAGVKLPFLGGTFLRLMPKNFIASRLAGLNALGLPGILYCHSWEFGEIAPTGTGLTKQLIQYSNVASVAKKVEYLARSFKFAPAGEVLGLSRGPELNMNLSAKDMVLQTACRLPVSVLQQ